MKNWRAKLSTIAILSCISASPCLAQANPSTTRSKPIPASTETQSPAVQAPAPQRYLLLATFGYLGGQSGFMLNKGNGAAASSISIIYNSSSQCEFAENLIKEKWRNDVVNTVCMPFPDGAVVAR